MCTCYSTLPTCIAWAAKGVTKLSEVHQINKVIKEDMCDGTFGTGKCAPWVLVLPPWCRLAHWRSQGGNHVPWSAFFEPSALRSSKVTVLEFEDYAAIVGSPKVDLVVSGTQERIPRKEMHGRRQGGFYGWANARSACDDRSQGGNGIAPHEWEPDEQRWRVDFSGNCDGGVLAIDYRCAVISSSSGSKLTAQVIQLRPYGEVTWLWIFFSTVSICVNYSLFEPSQC
eukprot:TRINITY_DN13881_c0_g1_i5.p1 TRINITY_DN13881_c0_g1~~TRINITY_DN13881_c0_g1_i5.p1  ORF type:complete len:227 (-),score=33.17 TRINITY_DN13881_c0_g1_i5:17-697(-)